MAVDSDNARIGIYLCKCGGNIGDVINIEAIKDSVRAWDGVVVSRFDNYLCSKPAQDIIYQDIERFNLNRVIVASCTPRMHLQTFREVLKRARLNPYFLEFVNIREQCSWVHGPNLSVEATRKAENLIKGGYEKSFVLEPLQELSEKASQEVLVVGGGIAGITSSLELESQGFRVHLVERLPSIGGNMAKLTKVFPTLDCAQCILTPRIAEAGRMSGINLLSYSEVRDVSGRPGNYIIKIYKKPRGVNIEECRGCGLCARVCPVSTPDDFNEGRSERTAAYLAFPHAVPYAYTIDFENCIKCGKCEEVCPSKAINLEDEGEMLTFNVGSIVLATGYKQYQASNLVEYGYGLYPDVITMMELERLTSLFGPTQGRIQRFSDGENVDRIAIVLCAGSRDMHRYIPYCSRICCMFSIKQAILLKEMLGKEVWIFYTDIRATGRGYEELYWRAQEAGVVFVRGKASEIWKDGNTKRLVVRVEDTLTGDVMEEAFDMVALALAMVPSDELGALAKLASIPLGEDGFIQELHPKLDPVNTLKSGVFACGCNLGPKDVRDTVSDSLGCAAKSASFLREGRVTSSPEKAFVTSQLCDGCGACMQMCPSNAITIVDKKAVIDPFLCIGCGGCIPECPLNAIDFKGSTRTQINATLKGLLADKGEEEVRLIAFVEKSIGYTGVDFLGLDRTVYPENVRVVLVPTTAILGFDYILRALYLGADGIIIIEGQHEIDKSFTRERFTEYKDMLDEIGVDSMRLYYNLVELPAYRNIARIFEIYSQSVEDLGQLETEELDAIERMMNP
jgi:heterodisulfide reductase subunit A